MISRQLGRASSIYFYSSIKVSTNLNKQVAYLTLSNAEKRNPLSLGTLKEIFEGLNQIEERMASQKLKILILRGEGSVFSAGHDLIQLKNTKNPEDVFNMCTKVMVKLKKNPLITLCAANNTATAAGFQLALTCDLILASQSVMFGIPGMKRGLFPSTPLVQLERSLKSPCLIKDITLVGDMMTANEALQHGLVNKVVPENQFESQIQKYVYKASHLSGEVLALGKRVLNNQVNMNLSEAYCVAIEGMRENIIEKTDCREGLTAFAEKRSPRFDK